MENIQSNKLKQFQQEYEIDISALKIGDAQINENKTDSPIKVNDTHQSFIGERVRFEDEAVSQSVEHMKKTIVQGAKTDSNVILESTGDLSQADFKSLKLTMSKHGSPKPTCCSCSVRPAIKRYLC